LGRPVTAYLCAVAFLSGSAALLFETLWFRVSGLAFGNGLWASSIVLASFMGGLAVGNSLAASLAWRIARPIRFYAALELAIGVTGAALVWLVPSLTHVLAELFEALRDTPWVLDAVRFPLSFALMMVPATAMGATLPVLVKASFGGGDGFGHVLGRLYGWNTFGAVVGALLGELWLIGELGIRGSAVVAAGLDVVAALGAFGLAICIEPGRTSLRGAVERPRLSPAALRLLAAAFLGGAVFLALEVVWFRFLSLFVIGTSVVFAVLLAVVLVGISSGGLLASRMLRSGARSAPYLPTVALVAASGTLLCYAGFGSVLDVFLPPGTGATAAASPLHVTLLSAPLMLPVAILSGVLFTAIGDAARESLVEAARTTGLLTLANTVGAALGALLGGFVLLPHLGVEGSLLALAAGYVAVAALAWPPAGTVRSALPFGAVSVLVVVFAAALLVFPYGRLRSDYVQRPAEPFASENPRVVAVREGPIQTIVYTRADRFGVPLFFRLFTDGYSMSSTRTEARRYMKGFVYLPAALHPEIRSALLISYGVGSTADALIHTPSLERLDVVDISSDILEMSRVVFPDPAEDPLNDSRTRAHVEDGRFFLQTTRKRYDVITGEPPPPKYAGVVNLYTREYFRLIRGRLNPGGMATYWLPAHGLDADDASSVVQAFCDIFPDCTLWNGSGLDWILLGTRGSEGRAPVTPAHFRRLWQNPDRQRELSALGFEHPEQLAATFMAGPERLQDLTGTAKPLVDDFPHRLSDRPVLPWQAVRRPLFRALLDVEASRRDFARSPTVARLLPEAVREAALPWFRWQELLNRRLVVGHPEPPGNESLYRVLTETSLRAPALWMLGSSAEEQRLARSLPAGRAARSDVQRVLGIGALADRNYESSARHFRRAHRGRFDPRTANLEILALCLAGEIERASRVARRLVGEVDAAARNDGHWRWLESTFGLPDPRRAGAGRSEVRALDGARDGGRTGR